MVPSGEINRHFAKELILSDHGKEHKRYFDRS